VLALRSILQPLSQVPSAAAASWTTEHSREHLRMEVWLKRQSTSLASQSLEFKSWSHTNNNKAKQKKEYFILFLLCWGLNLHLLGRCTIG
jgi:hypothetical protein